MAFHSPLRRHGDVGAKRGRVEALMRGHVTRHGITPKKDSFYHFGAYHAKPKINCNEGETRSARTKNFLFKHSLIKLY